MAEPSSPFVEVGTRRVPVVVVVVVRLVMGACRRCGGASLMFNWRGGGFPSAFVDGRSWILVVVVVVGSRCSSTGIF
jgi:hypothetical protein